MSEAVEQRCGHLGITEHVEMPQRLTVESSRVRVIDPRHPLYGECYPVSERRSGRGPGLIVVLLPGGRERSIPRAATAPASLPNGELATASSSRAHFGAYSFCLWQITCALCSPPDRS